MVASVLKGFHIRRNLLDRGALGGVDKIWKAPDARIYCKGLNNENRVSGSFLV